MPYDIEVDAASGLIRLHYFGEITLEQRINVLNKVIIEYSMSEKSRFIIDVRDVTNVLKPIEQEVLGRYIASRSEFNHTRIALLVRENQSLNNELITHASGSGLTVRNFNNADEAIVWCLA